MNNKQQNLEVREGQFYLGEKPFQLLSGAIHYFRVVPEYWRDRLEKLKACGFNTVETYIAWNVQEPKQGQFTFEGIADFEQFIQIAEELGLYVIVRPGPFICAEWEMGGFPAWLLTIDNIQLRKFNTAYLEQVDRYFDAVIPRLVPHLTTHGGNIIAVQVENEYGGFGAKDQKYLSYLKEGLTRRGIDVLLFTSDGTWGSCLEDGRLEDVLMTANFGSRQQEAFEKLQKLQPNAPLVCMEFWDGWFDQWGKAHHTREADSVMEEFEAIVRRGAGINMYMFHGGTNFGFMNGSNCNPVFEPTITSYDYGAPLNEYGEVTELYQKLRSFLAAYQNQKPAPLPLPVKTAAYGAVTFTRSASIFEKEEFFDDKITASQPVSMEDAGQNYGYILYTAQTNGICGKLSIGEPRDRAMVFVDGIYAGLLERDGQMDEILIQGNKLQIFVENMGHVNYGPRIYDKKGLVGPVYIGEQEIAGFTIQPLSFQERESFDLPLHKEHQSPAVYQGTFQVQEKHDTFLALETFTRGVAFINGFPLGRYDKRGPQKTLYVPGPILKEGENVLTVFDCYPTHAPQAQLNSQPVLGQ